MKEKGKRQKKKEVEIEKWKDISGKSEAEGKKTKEESRKTKGKIRK